VYKKINTNQLKFNAFSTPFGGDLDSNNRWILLALKIPWSKLEKKYAKLFCEKDGRPAISVRVAFGALIIKSKLNLTDRETVLQISENPYLQYFIGYKAFSLKPPFVNSMMSEFRKRFSIDDINEINELIVDENKENDSNSDDEDPPENKGQLKIDATCAPQDIPYPTDVNLLNEARECSEKLIDKICEYHKIKKPRTYRKIARKNYLAFIKKKGRSKKIIQKVIKKQLQYLRRNIKEIETIAKSKGLMCFAKRDLKILWVIQEVFRQQEKMYVEKSSKTENRIVNIYQPHVRPIVRGKAGKPVEFGAKLSVSVINGMCFLDRHEWEAYNEGNDLEMQVENYKTKQGFYPEVVCADKIYGNRKNRNFLKTKGIKFSGAPLGRPKPQSMEERKQFIKDQKDRNEIEGKFGIAKRRYSLGLIMTKLKHTSESWASMMFLVMNLDKITQRAFLWLTHIHHFNEIGETFKGFPPINRIIKIGTLLYINLLKIKRVV